MLYLWLKWTAAGAPDLAASLIEWIYNQRIPWGVASGYKVCDVSALSISRFMGTVLIGDPEEEQEREKWQSLICSIWGYAE